MEWADLLLVKFFVPISWPLAAFIVLIYYKKSVFDWFSKRNVKVTASGMEMVISKVEETHQLSLAQQKELQGLSAHDIWALETFSVSQSKSIISDKMPPASKVIAKTFLDAGILIRDGNKLKLTSLGDDILKRAKEIL